MTTKTEAIQNFLSSNTRTDLAQLYHHDMECQVIVEQGSGQRIAGEFRDKRSFSYEDPETGERWSSFHIPWNSWKDPSYEDSQINFRLDKHVEAIGMTGWNWKKRESHYVAYDFDAMSGHVQGLTQKELEEVKQRACDIPWVTVRSSTSGAGLHLYVFLEPVSTQNHTEHAALARSILHKMSGLVGFDFESRVDICGGNMWVWHKKMSGLELIKSGTRLSNIPQNWKEHLIVASGKSKRVNFIKNKKEWDKLSSEVSYQTLDEEHRKLIHWLDDEQRFYWYDSDYHMLVTHTVHLKHAHEHLKMIGMFETESPGTDLNQQNCFLYPIENGAWSVRRYGPGTPEHPYWEQDGKSWTKCFLNVRPTFDRACLTFEAVEDPQGGYIFKTIKRLKKALDLLDTKIDLPIDLRNETQIHVSRHKENNKLILAIDSDPVMRRELPDDWIYKRGKFVKVVSSDLSAKPASNTHDDSVRHIVTARGEDSGWVVNSNGTWHDEPLTHIKSVLLSYGLKNADVNQIIGGNVLQPWKLVNKPFQDRYLGDRQWNRYAPQLKYTPEPMRHDTWLSVFTHLGRGLDSAVLDNKWCQTAGVKTGAEYLFFWVACMIQYPSEPLPYLFIYGKEQNTGKSTFHEAIRLLFEGGYQEANTALDDTTFNAEIEGCVLCVVEEMNLQANSKAYNKIKNWVTAPMLSIHRKHVTPYMTENTTHWIHTANARSFCPVFPNDTRITYVHVEHRPEREIPKSALFVQLEKEAPGILHALTTLEIKPSDSRLRLPVLDTHDKTQAIDQQKNSLERFIEQECFYAPGQVIPLSSFKARFLQFIDETERPYWTNPKITYHMPEQFVKGVYKNQHCWGNISFDEPIEANVPAFYTDGVALKLEKICLPTKS